MSYTPKNDKLSDEIRTDYPHRIVLNLMLGLMYLKSKTNLKCAGV